MRNTFPRGHVVVAVAGLLVLELVVLAAAADPQRFSDWSAPVNLGPLVNSSVNDSGAFISKDGLSLYFGSIRPGGVGNFDIWVSRRAGIGEPWGVPQNLGPSINTTRNEQTPALSLDGLTLYFSSDRTGGRGKLDLYRARRPDPRDDSSWREPENLGGAVNSIEDDSGPSSLEDDAAGRITLFFGSARPDGLGFEDIYVSTAGPDGRFGAATLDRALSGPLRDVRPTIRPGGLEIYIDSNRTGSLSDSVDIWMSSRASVRDAWSPPVRLSDVVNSPGLEARPVVSFDGTELYFHSNRPGGSGINDVYVSRRSRIKAGLSF